MVLNVAGIGFPSQPHGVLNSELLARHLMQMEPVAKTNDQIDREITQ